MEFNSQRPDSRCKKEEKWELKWWIRIWYDGWTADRRDQKCKKKTQSYGVWTLIKQNIVDNLDLSIIRWPNHQKETSQN